MTLSTEGERSLCKLDKREGARVREKIKTRTFRPLCRHTRIGTSGIVKALNSAFREFWPVFYNKQHIQSTNAETTGVFTYRRTVSAFRSTDARIK